MSSPKQNNNPYSLRTRHATPKKRSSSDADDLSTESNKKRPSHITPFSSPKEVTDLSIERNQNQPICIEGMSLPISENAPAKLSPIFRRSNNQSTKTSTTEWIETFCMGPSPPIFVAARKKLYNSGDIHHGFMHGLVSNVRSFVIKDKHKPCDPCIAKHITPTLNVAHAQLPTLRISRANNESLKDSGNKKNYPAYLFICQPCEELEHLHNNTTKIEEHIANKVSMYLAETDKYSPGQRSREMVLLHE